MAFLRVKRIRGRDYAYLVESKWDPARRTSRQVVIKYMGPLEEVRLEDVPPGHRNERVKAFIFHHASAAQDRRKEVVSELRKRLLKALTLGDGVETSMVAEEACGLMGLDSFYAEILTPVMHEVGVLWKRGELSVSMEHLASNIIEELLLAMNARIRVTARSRGTAVICTPEGEMHRLVSRVLEGLLLKRGYRPWNIVASAPTESIADFIASKKPDLVLVSLTIPQYLPSLKRLLNAIQERKPGARVVVGGQGLLATPQGALPAGTILAGDEPLEALDRASGIRHQSA